VRELMRVKKERERELASMKKRVDESERVRELPSVTEKNNW
jgi:hypothetical protein